MARQNLVVEQAVPQVAAPAVAAPAVAAPAVAPAVAPTTIPLPTPTDYASVLTYITSIVAVIIGVIVAFKPGFTEPPALQAAVPAVALLVATGAQIYNAISHRNAHTSAAVAALNRGGTAVSATPNA